MEKDKKKVIVGMSPHKSFRDSAGRAARKSRKDSKSRPVLKNKRVVIGMSGGVDSSVTAALLKTKGYEVTGLFMRFWKTDDAKKSNKEQNKAKNDAKKVAEILGIPLKIIDVRRLFKKEIVGYFLNEYEAGRTPNPCVFCNENFKFKILLEERLKLKADYVATGHYARLWREIPNSKLQIPSRLKIQNARFKTKYKLLKARDKNKDQSYFLYRLKQKQLSRIIFPLGEYKKEEVRKLAEKFNLPVAKKEESQDICFLAGVGTGEFLKKNLKLKKGKIADNRGKVIGVHAGLALYTIGQRKGINIGGAGPFYVVKKDYGKNRLIVVNNPKERLLFSKTAVIEKINWTGEKPALPTRFLARTRYRNPLVYATIKSPIFTDKKSIADKTRKECVVEFEKPQRALASGQSVVFYAGEGEVVGGGIVGNF